MTATALAWVASHRAPHVWLEIRYHWAPLPSLTFSAAWAMFFTLAMRACDVGWLCLACWMDRRVRLRMLARGTPLPPGHSSWRAYRRYLQKCRQSPQP